MDQVTRNQQKNEFTANSTRHAFLHFMPTFRHTYLIFFQSGVLKYLKNEERFHEKKMKKKIIIHLDFISETFPYEVTF